MTRPITLFTGQWADLPFEEMCRLASGWGYDGLEIACWGDHFEVDKALHEDGYVDRKKETLAKYNLSVYAISNHLVGQAVCDHPIDQRHQGILPARIWGDGSSEGVRERAAAEMAQTFSPYRSSRSSLLCTYSSSSQRHGSRWSPQQAISRPS